MGVPVVIGRDNLPSPVGIGLTDLPNIGGPLALLAPPVPAPLGFVGTFHHGLLFKNKSVTSF